MKQNNDQNLENYQSNEIDLMEIIYPLWKKKLFITSFTLILTIAVGAFLYFYIPISYKKQQLLLTI